MRFSSFRINLLTEPNSLFAEFENKEGFFSEAIDSIKNEKKRGVTIKKDKFFIYHIKLMGDGIHLLQFAKEEIETVPVEGDTKIEDVQFQRTPYIYIIVDVKRQIFLFEDKTAVFQRPEYAASKIEYYLRGLFANNYITPSITPITDKKDFWDFVDNADGVRELEVTLNAPNLFKGRHKAEELAEEAKEEFNITDISIILRNKFNALKIVKDEVAEYIKLASSGAGSYVVKVIKNAKLLVLKSYQSICKKDYDVDDPANIPPDELNSDLDELDHLNED